MEYHDTAMMMGPLTVVAIIILHTPGDHQVGINPDKIVSMREDEGRAVISDHVKCLINTNDGKFIGVVESCEEVRSLMMGVR